MDYKSIVVALILLAVLFRWYVWLEAGERRRRRAGRELTPHKGEGGGGRRGADGELWKAE